jgi:hypothetical protein
MSKFLDMAVGYAERGYEVLPLNGKTPLTSRGFYDATTDPEVIRSWWSRWPDANVGCRPPEDTIIFDVDPRNGGDLSSLGDYPVTRTAQTGSGGWHVWFAARGKFRGALLGAPGVDIKTANSLVVMPPSIHPVTGKPYRWTVSGPVAALPVHLVDRVVKPPRKRVVHGSSRITDRQVDGIIRKMEDAVTEGERNNTLHWCACRLFERNAPVDAFVRLELAAASTGLDEDEIMRTIESAGKQAK